MGALEVQALTVSHVILTPTFLLPSTSTLPTVEHEDFSLPDPRHLSA